MSLNGKKVCLVIIDPQMDFINGSLAVPGADDDMSRVAEMIRKYGKEIDDIQITMDSHYKTHIAHGLSWKDRKDEHPVPIFLHKGNTVPTFLTLQMVLDGEYRATNPGFQKRYIEYLKKLEANGRYQLMIWPEHCIIGSPGQCIQPDLLDAISGWEARYYGAAQRTTKGSNPFTEHYSALIADVEDPEDEGTRLNTDFISVMKYYDLILGTGEALSHCFANTFKDIFNEFGAKQLEKFALLEDATSNVPGCNKMGEDFINEYTTDPYNMQIFKTTNIF